MKQRSHLEISSNTLSYVLRNGIKNVKYSYEILNKSREEKMKEQMGCPVSQFFVFDLEKNTPILYVGKKENNLILENIINVEKEIKKSSIYAIQPNDMGKFRYLARMGYMNKYNMNHLNINEKLSREDGIGAIILFEKSHTKSQDDFKREIYGGPNEKDYNDNINMLKDRHCETFIYLPTPEFVVDKIKKNNFNGFSRLPWLYGFSTEKVYSFDATFRL